MGWFSKLLGREPAETKSLDVSPEIWAALNGGWGLPTKSGNSVSTTTALQNMAFYRGVVAIAEGIAQLPVEIYRKSGKGVEPAVDHPLYDMLMHRPNVLQDAFQFWRTTLMHAVGAGNGVSYRNVVNGQVRELIPIRPECVSIDIEPTFYTAIYDITFEKGGYVSVGQNDVFHIKGPSWAPHKALDPAVVGREALGLAQATEEAHSRLFSNGARPSGVLSSDQKMDKALIERLREQWRAAYTGVGKTGETVILGGGLKFQSIAQNGVDSEHIDTRKLGIEDIARLLGIFPIMLGHAGDQSPTFASAEAFFAAHVRYSLQPLIKNVRSAIETQLLTKDERREGYHVRIDTSELLRGSLQDRTAYYKAALGTNSSPGWMSIDEVREDDGWNPVEGEGFDRPLTPKDYGMGGQPPASGDAVTPPAEAKSSTPRTLYVCRKLVNDTEFLAWAKKQGFKETLAASDLHVTVAYSRARVDWMAVDQAWSFDDEADLIVPAGGPRVVEAIGDKGAIALKFKSAALQWRHEAIREAGATWDHAEYQPHVTITWNGEGVDLAKIEPFRGQLHFGPEIFSELDDERAK